jgi:hypothetical protein
MAQDEWEVAGRRPEQLLANSCHSFYTEPV